ncbi:hypothetical protein L3X38_035732 [Prunus dulcis]|uniref:Tetratricopeptide repeat-like superfamily protein n=1 Tax=Prunus dulcis TaxID=3755 RepID=A0AAD4VKG5_PRUDU|nr:hypothetical protein L3X38_035732 [Prunus dulcis]
MGSKTLFKWSKQITTSQVEQLIKAEKEIHKAILIFDSATAEYTNGFRHDHTTFGLMVARLVSANQFRSAEALLDRMKEEKCSVTEDIFLSVCRGCGCVHRPLDAVRVFHKMEDFQCKLTQKSYITILGILVEENRLKIAFSSSMGAALRIFCEMSNHGCPPDSDTYGTLINGLCKLGKIGEAKELFNEMETKGCLPSVVTYTSLIHGFCQTNNLDEAVGLFEHMKTKCLYLQLFDGWTLQGWAFLHKQWNY